MYACIFTLLKISSYALRMNAKELLLLFYVRRSGYIKQILDNEEYFLNQAHAWFLEITFVCDIGICVCVCACVRACVCVCVCVCVHPRGCKLHSCDIEPVEKVCYI